MYRIFFIKYGYVRLLDTRSSALYTSLALYATIFLSGNERGKEAELPGSLSHVAPPAYQTNVRITGVSDQQL